jgi:hypothetical protein
MKRVRNNTILFIGTIMFASGCDPLTSNRRQSPALLADTVAMKDAGDTTKLQNIITHDLTPAVENPAARVLNEADKRYIDWIIPDYPDVILLHEGNTETLNYTEEVYRYLNSKNASVRKKIITQKHKDKARDKRLYIDDVGENWYEVYVFDEWKRK